MLQTSFVAGMEQLVTGECKVQVTLRKEIASDLLMLSKHLKKPMTIIVSEALSKYTTDEVRIMRNQMKIV